MGFCKWGDGVWGFIRPDNFLLIVSELFKISSRSSFVTLLSRRAQCGRWSSFGKRMWFTESHL